MKKYFIVLMLLTGMVQLVPAQTETAKTPAPEDVAHWSFGVKAGLNYYRLAPAGNGLVDAIGWTFPGLFAEYTINPLFGMGAELQFLSFNRAGALGNTLDGNIYGSVNMLNLFIPERDRTGFWGRMNTFVNFGLGLQSSRYDITGGASGNGLSAVVPTTLKFEFPINDLFAVGAEAQYRFYLNESIGGLPVNGLSTDAFVAAASLRYKLGANDKKHVQNMTMDEFYPAPAPVIIENIIKEDTPETKKRLNDLENENAEIRTKLQQLEDDLKALAANKASGPQSAQATFHNIGFKFGSQELTSESTSLLDEVASILKANSQYSKLTIAGHTDATGPEDYNQELGLMRAQAVKDYLLSKGVKGENIEVVSFGEDKPIDTNETIEGRANNRRVEFDFQK